MDLGILPSMLGGLVGLVVGADLLVRGASRFAAKIGLSPLVIGLTVVAFGTSAPEAAVSIKGALAGPGGADVALGNVLGSNVFNVLFILGACALVTPLVVTSRLVRLDVPLLVVVSGLVWLLAADGGIARWEGIVLFALLIAHTAWLVRQSRRATAAQAASEMTTVLPIESPTPPEKPIVDVVFIVVGLGLLVVGADWFVDGAVGLARTFGLSELVIGLTIVAAGTSLPEVATSIVAGLRGQRDIAVGNVVGSNLFNLLGVLGAAAAVAPDGIAVARTALRFDFPVMMAATLVCMPIFATRQRVDRWEGALFLLVYAAYVAWLILTSTGHAAQRGFGQAMAFFVLPLILLVIAVSVVRHHRRSRAGA